MNAFCKFCRDADRQTVVTAEIGINHNGDLERAKRLVDAAWQAGADLVKTQVYRTDERVPQGHAIESILKQMELTPDEMAQLFAYAQQQGIVLYATPFSVSQVALMVDWQSPLYKLASFHMTHKELIAETSKTGKPVICSTGMISQGELDQAVEIFSQDKTEYALLHCISAYPVPDASAYHLSAITELAHRYACPVGYSDHAPDCNAIPLAIALGATLIERHFDLADREGIDQAVSSTPDDFAQMVKHVRQTQAMLGDSSIRLHDEETGILPFREFQY